MRFRFSSGGIFQSTFLLSLNTVFSAGVNFVFWFIIGIYLNLNTVGQFSTISSSIQLIALFSRFGLDVAILNKSKRYKQNPIVMSILLFVSGTTTLLALGYYLMNSNSLHNVSIFLFVFVTSLWSIFTLLDYYFISVGELTIILIKNFTVGIIRFLLLVILIFSSYPITLNILITLWGIPGLLLLVFYKKYTTFIKNPDLIKIGFKDLKTVPKSGALLNQASMVSDQGLTYIIIILGNYLLSDEDLGIVFLALNIGLIIHSLPRELTRISISNQENAIVEYKQTRKRIIGLVVVYTIFLFILRTFILYTKIGISLELPNMLVISMIVSISAISMIPYRFLLAFFMSNDARVKFGTLLQIVTLGLILLLSFFLIQNFGIFGIPLAILLSYTILGIVTHIFITLKVLVPN
ncbi:MAG: hypothetical protein INQ03_24415 [Candidatus Heimdallarchaeota archaeon]|nr:hypothetical protein [Candidatus Heimdallarchaeota archaeon]